MLADSTVDVPSHKAPLGGAIRHIRYAFKAVGLERTDMTGLKGGPVMSFGCQAVMPRCRGNRSAGYADSAMCCDSCRYINQKKQRLEQTKRSDGLHGRFSAYHPLTLSRLMWS